ncbi:helix-turn-helix domain-containing protein [Bradyrhizobium sp. Pha-3]|uniref:helix-turn-helix domain-containing protein n=1 Tax=Bradyrhizobium sp. Pha-3 TaxID=208375 RepID=UPI0035D4BD7C
MKMEAAAIAYVRYVLNISNLSPSALAKKAKLSSTTLTRALNDPSHRFTLSTTTLEKVRDATGISFAPFFEAEDQVNLTTASVHPPEAFLDRGGRTLPLNRQTPFSAMAVVIGEVAPGYWQDPALAATEHLPLTVALVGTQPKNTFACIARGSGAMPFAAAGEYLLCRRLLDEKELTYLNGRAFIVQAKSPRDKFRIELTARLLQGRSKGYDLVTLDKSDWKRMASITHFNRLSDLQDAQILGLVEYIVRDPGPSIHLMAAEAHMKRK